MVKAERPVHWNWLHGPADSPDPRVGDMSASAANRHSIGIDTKGALWDEWLGQPWPPLQEEGAA